MSNNKQEGIEPIRDPWEETFKVPEKDYWKQGTHVVVPVEDLEKIAKSFNRPDDFESLFADFPRINPSQQQKEIEELKAIPRLANGEIIDEVYVEELEERNEKQQQQIKLLREVAQQAYDRLSSLRCAYTETQIGYTETTAIMNWIKEALKQTQNHE